LQVADYAIAWDKGFFFTIHRITGAKHLQNMCRFHSWLNFQQLFLSNFQPLIGSRAKLCSQWLMESAYPVPEILDLLTKQLRERLAQDWAVNCIQPALKSRNIVYSRAQLASLGQEAFLSFRQTRDNLVQVC
jgi:hypothetical protein